MEKVSKPGGIPFAIQVSGVVNGETFSVKGEGAVNPLGTYIATLNFSNIPQGFHPVVMTAYTCSICCYMHAAMRNSALNMHKMGVRSYDSERKLTFPNGDSIVITGSVSEQEDSIRFKGEIEGKVSVPEDIACNAYYNTYLRPAGPGKIVGTGVGSCFRSNGEEIPVGVETKYSFDIKRSLPSPQYRIVTEHGSLEGLTYKLVLHSVLDRVNTMTMLVPKEKL